MPSSSSVTCKTCKHCVSSLGAKSAWCCAKQKSVIDSRLRVCDKHQLKQKAEK